MSNHHRRPLRALALVFAASLSATACGAVPGLGGDDEATDAPVEATETTLAAAGAETETTAAAAEAEAPADDGVDEAARAVGRTGPIRELPGLAQWADLDLHPFLVEVLNMPPETPIPDGLVVTYADVRQDFRDEGASSSLSFSGSFLPTFERDAFRTMIPEMMDAAIWTATAVDEDLENNSTRLEFQTEDPASPYRTVWFKFEDADTSSQAKFSMGANGVVVEGRSELIVNETLYPWMGEIDADPTWTRWFASVNLGRLDGKSELDVRWNGPIGTFLEASATYAAPTGGGLVPGAQEYSDSVWPSNDTPVTREGGFEGTYGFNETDPEREISISLIGRTDHS